MTKETREIAIIVVAILVGAIAGFYGADVYERTHPTPTPVVHVGTPGPSGVPGPQGLQGPAGPQGPTGITISGDGRG